MGFAMTFFGRGSHDRRRHLRPQAQRIKKPVMGSLYQPMYRGADGTLKESSIIWLKYRDALGVLRREASGTDKEHEARRLLKQREGAAVEREAIG